MLVAIPKSQGRASSYASSNRSRDRKAVTKVSDRPDPPHEVPVQDRGVALEELAELARLAERGGDDLPVGRALSRHRLALHIADCPKRATGFAQ